MGSSGQQNPESLETMDRIMITGLLFSSSTSITRKVWSGAGLAG